MRWIVPLLALALPLAACADSGPRRPEGEASERHDPAIHQGTDEALLIGMAERHRTALSIAEAMVRSGTGDTALIRGIADELGEELVEMELALIADDSRAAPTSVDSAMRVRPDSLRAALVESLQDEVTELELRRPGLTRAGVRELADRMLGRRRRALGALRPPGAPE